MTNAVQFFVDQGFRITSNPNRYASGVWGLRNYTVNNYNYDSYCNGYHRAYDFAKSHLANIPSPVNGTVVAGTSGYGNFGGTVVVLDEDEKYQHIFGHLARNIPVKIGQKVKKGQTVGRQSSTNYYGSYMASHLHYQVQPAGYRPEQRFVCDGIDPLNVNVGGSSNTNVSKNVLTYEDAWDYTGKVKLTANTNYRIYPHTDAPREATIKKGTTLTFDRIYVSDGHWWIRTKYKGGIWFVAVGKRNKKKTFLKLLDDGDFWVSPIGKVNTKGGKVNGKKRGYSLDGSNTAEVPKNTSTNVSNFNRYATRPRRYTAYFRGVIATSDGKGAAVRKYNNGNYNVQHAPDLKDGDVVYVFQVRPGGWARVYSGSNNGYVHLDRVRVTQRFV